MKKYILYIFIGFLVTNVSCKRMLEVPPNLPGQLVTGQVFADSINAVNGVVGIYSQAFASASPLNGNLSLYISLSADDITSSSTYYQNIYNNQLTVGDAVATTGSTGTIWNSLYGSTMIYQANAALDALSAAKQLSPGLKSQLIGECLFIRSLCYFYLTNLYGAVPLALTSDYKTNNKLPRSSTDEVYDQIIKDLVEASKNLSVQYPSAGRARPNRYAAMALLSRVYLYRQQWKSADSLSTLIIGSGLFSMETLDRVFVVENNEAIWQGLITGFYSYAAQDGINFIPYATSIVPTFPLMDTLVNSFEPGDLRKSQWTAFNTVNDVTYYYPNKFKNASGRQVDGRVEAQVPFRLSEQYLIRAEARINEGRLEDAADDIQVVRARAGLSKPDVLTKEALFAAVVHERQVEFFCEWGHRWFDLKRWNIISQTMNAVKPGLWPADGHSALYPISYDQMILNPGWVQNSGY